MSTVEFKDLLISGMRNRNLSTLNWRFQQHLTGLGAPILVGHALGQYVYGAAP